MPWTEPQLFQSSDALSASSARLHALWTDIRDAPASGGARERLRRPEAAAMIAAARRCIGAAARTESRGMHRRIDHPARRPGVAARLETAGSLALRAAS